MGRSLGGSVVDRSLEAAGFDPTWEGCAIVETALPRPRPYTSVLVQSAWNVIPWREFLQLSSRYSLAIRVRMVARRLVSWINIKRAERVVGLTHDIARTTQALTGREVHVAPVHGPVDVNTEGVHEQPPESREVLVVGTVTWYKAPLEALTAVAAWRQQGLDLHLCFLGPDDGSGAKDELVARAAQLEVPVSFGVVPREELVERMRSAWAVIVPSRLESLSFGFIEALTLARRVYASPIGPHLELARALERTPVWLPDVTVVPSSTLASVERAAVLTQWRGVADALRLPSLTH